MVDREDFEFESHGTICRGWFYPAQNESMSGPAGVPAVIMAHGPCGTRDAGLEPYAARFAEAGLAVLIFDYRNFGASDGDLRQMLSVSGQQGDWISSLAAVRAVDGVDAQRIALWGTSLSGGHVVAVGAADLRVAAIIAMAPVFDCSVAAWNVLRRRGPWAIAKFMVAGVRDYLADLAGADPYCVPLVAPKGQFAAMATDEAWMGYERIMPAHWRNEISARTLLGLGWYRPGHKIGRVSCPVLVQICDNDEITSPEMTVNMAALGGDNVVEHHYRIGHFDTYSGVGFRRSSTDQVNFLKRSLAPRRP